MLEDNADATLIVAQNGNRTSPTPKPKAFDAVYRYFMKKTR
jgi:hypothetical protein